MGDYQAVKINRMFKRALSLCEQDIGHLHAGRTPQAWYGLCNLKNA